MTVEELQQQYQDALQKLARYRHDATITSAYADPNVSDLSVAAAIRAARHTYNVTARITPESLSDRPIPPYEPLRSAWIAAKLYTIAKSNDIPAAMLWRLSLDE